MPDKEEDASWSTSSMEPRSERQDGAGGRPVATEEAKFNSTTLDKWLDPSPISEEPMWIMALYDTAAAWQPWESCPEAIMVETGELKKTIIKRICKELGSLATWMKGWDELIAQREWKRIQDRGRDGQCRESTKKGVCESWDPTIPNSKPRFIDQDRMKTVLFYGGSAKG